MPPKRPLRNIFGDDEEDQEETIPEGAAMPIKRTKTGASAAPIGSIQAQIEAARAKVQAQMSALNNRSGAPSAVRLPPSRSIAPSAAAPTPRPPAPTPSAPSINDIQRKVAEAKARLQAMQSKPGVQQSLSASSSEQGGDESRRPVGIHPLLLGGDSSKVQERVRSLAPKFATLQANAKSSPSSASRDSIMLETNPYLATAMAETQDGAPSKQRSMHKGFAFHRPGRHIEQADEIRRERQMEDLKRRIQETARKAGMQDDLTGGEKVIKRPAPPEVEWWDLALLPNKTYNDVPEDDVATMLEKGKQREQDETVAGPLLFGKDSPIDPYIQHPILIPAPSDKVQIKPKGVMLTKKEMKKMRRQRRQAEQQDKRDRIKMGLLPPDPPKVKLSNLMRVLTSEAVADPTKVEARVRREVAARREAHERMNAERQLTDEQRRDKKLRKVEEDEEKGVGCQVYRIKHLVSPSHKFKVRKNAHQYHLSGVTIFNPSFALVIVEGPYKGLKGYKRLMTVRIDWTDPGRPKEVDGEQEEEEAAAETQKRGGFKEFATNQDGEEVDLTDNTCELIFEGPQRDRMFQGFKALSCPTDHLAKEALGPKMEGYWDLAKRWAAAQDDGL